MGILEEQVSSIVYRTRAPKEAQVQSARRGDAKRLRQMETRSRFVGLEENAHAVHQQSVREAIDHRAQHLVEIFFGAEFAAEFHQCSAVVVAGAIENLVQPLLNPVFDGIKEQRRYDHGEDEACRTAARNPRLNQLRYSGYDSEIDAHNGCGRERVNDAAFKD